MEQSSCTEDRIQHALERCLCGLGLNTPNKNLWNAGLCISRWCLEELVKRDVDNFLILLQQILRKTKEVLELCQYERVVPLTLLFSSTLLKTPYLAPECGLLQEAYLLFHRFLSWPEPCCSASKRLLQVIRQELSAPGISFQRLVREEQGLASERHSSKIMTVLLVSPDEDSPPEVRSASEQLGTAGHSQREVTVSLVKHALQAALGPRYPIQNLHAALQSKKPEDLDKLLAVIIDTMETAASTADPGTAREGLLHSMDKLAQSLSLSSAADGSFGTGTVVTLPLPFAKCHTCIWEKDNFDNLSEIITSELSQESPADCFPSTELNEGDVSEANEDDEDRSEEKTTNHRISTVSTTSGDSMFSRDSMLSSPSLTSLSVPSTLSESSGVDSDLGEDTEETAEGQPKLRKKPKKKSKSLLNVERFSLLFKAHRSPALCRRAQSMGYRDELIKEDFLPAGAQRSKRSKSLPQQVLPLRGPATLNPLSPRKHVCIRKRPILSCNEEDPVQTSTLVRVVVFGADREAGRLARAYSDLRQRESRFAHLTRTCKLQFYFIPAKRTILGSQGGGQSSSKGPAGGPLKATQPKESNGSMLEDSTTDIAQLMGVMDPWYERSVLSLLSLSSDILCQTTCKLDGDSGSGSNVEQLPLLADLVLYYCRHADQHALLQLYQAELTLAGGEKRKEVFIHSLELGHTAGTRAVKAMGAASKRFGIDGEREAVPLTLSVAHNKVAVSGRSQWSHKELVCTSINLYKACRKPEQIGSKMETLQLTIMEVLKRQCSKSKIGYNQHLSISEVEVDKVQVCGGAAGTTFAVCLDQDEKNIIQSVTRCEVSLCSKTGSNSDWRSYKTLPGQVQPLHTDYHSLLCLPIKSFTASHH